jgi:ribosomal protein S18 acetylase RimI-like enzyme
MGRDNSNIVVRAGRADDADVLIPLLGELFALEGFAVDPVCQRRGLEEMLSGDSRRCVWVAQDAGEIVGMCTGQVVISTAEGGEAALVEDVIVREDRRGRGIGRMLIGAVERWARQRGIRRLQLLAAAGNTRALGFYGRLGWHPTNMICLRRFVQDD